MVDYYYWVLLSMLLHFIIQLLSESIAYSYYTYIAASSASLISTQSNSKSGNWKKIWSEWVRFQTKIGESLHRWMHISLFKSSMKKAAKTFKTPDGVHIHSFHIFFHSSFHHTFSFRFTYYCTYATLACRQRIQHTCRMERLYGS